MSKKASMKRVSIVFEDTDSNATEEGKREGQGFRFYLTGFDPNRKSLPRNELTSAEFYATHFLMVIANTLDSIGVVRQVMKKPEDLG